MTQAEYDFYASRSGLPPTATLNEHQRAYWAAGAGVALPSGATQGELELAFYRSKGVESAFGLSDARMAWFKANARDAPAGASISDLMALYFANPVRILRNYALTPTMFTGVNSGISGNSNTVAQTTVTGGGPNGRDFRRAVVTTVGGTFTPIGFSAYLSTVAEMAFTDGTNVSIWVYTSKALTAQLQAQFYTKATSTNRGNRFGPNVALQPGWSRLSVPVAPGDIPALSDSVRPFVNFTPTEWAVDDVVGATMMMISDGIELYEYSDGGTPGWAWLAGVESSISEGPEYTLESVAPGLLSKNTTPNSVVPTPSSWQVSPYEPFTLYGVSETLTLGTIQPMVSVNGALGSNAATGGVVLRSGGASINRYEDRVSPLSGSAIIHGYGTGQRTVGRHIHTSIVAPEDASNQVLYYSALVDEGSLALANGPAANGYNARALLVHPATASESPIAGYLFNRAHTPEQQVAARAWIRNAHGIATSSGPPPGSLTIEITDNATHPEWGWSDQRLAFRSVQTGSATGDPQLWWGLAPDAIDNFATLLNDFGTGEFTRSVFFDNLTYGADPENPGADYTGQGLVYFQVRRGGLSSPVLALYRMPEVVWEGNTTETLASPLSAPTELTWVVKTQPNPSSGRRIDLRDAFTTSHFGAGRNSAANGWFSLVRVDTSNFVAQVAAATAERGLCGTSDVVGREVTVTTDDGLTGSSSPFARTASPTLTEVYVSHPDAIAWARLLLGVVPAQYRQQVAQAALNEF